jgi:hypothetical protein
MTDWLDGNRVYSETGVIVPAYFSAAINDDTVQRLLWMTLADLPRVVNPCNIRLVTDGDARTAGLAAQMLADQPDYGELLALPQNLGKLGAMRAGVQVLLAQRPQVRYVAFLDGDGDHMATVVPRLVRTAAAIAAGRQSEDVLVIGSRQSRARPMGWLRGELEELLDQVTMDALAFALAREGRVLDLSCCAPHSVCDISSGFKVFTRHLVEATVAQEPSFLGSLTHSDYDHYGPETTTVVEAVLAGATVVEMLRPTWDGQPTTAFGEFRTVALYGELLAWVWQRLDLTVGQAAAMLDNRIPARELRTTQEGSLALTEVRAYALERLVAWRGATEPLPSEPVLPSFF